MLKVKTMTFLNGIRNHATALNPAVNLKQVNSDSEGRKKGVSAIV
jgi:hypothetical protein